mmetsp:Transcript_11932/g.27859  ORF Transcript_11932/g.27859 Transcript_11932/m.27859 type:complete len:218 (+) Transcript_11932:232-885(+)
MIQTKSKTSRNRFHGKKSKNRLIDELGALLLLLLFRALSACLFEALCKAFKEFSLTDFLFTEMKIMLNQEVTTLDNRSCSQVATTTPPGWNAGRRSMARYALWLVVPTLVTGKLVWAMIFSATSILILKEGTFFSSRNIKWMILSAISFLASLGSWTLSSGIDKVDEEKAYGLSISLWLMNQFVVMGWAAILGLFLYSAQMSKVGSPPPREMTIKKE